MLSGELYCKRCGEEVRIVPDYNPLDDMLTQQIKVSINGEPDSASPDKAYTRNMRNTGRTSHLTQNEREARRRQAEKRREIKRKKRRRLLIAMSAILVTFIAIVIVMYLNSY